MLLMSSGLLTNVPTILIYLTCHCHACYLLAFQGMQTEGQWLGVIRWIQELQGTRSKSTALIQVVMEQW